MGVRSESGVDMAGSTKRGTGEEDEGEKSGDCTAEQKPFWTSDRVPNCVLGTTAAR